METNTEFKAICTAINTLSEEAKFNVTKDGLTFRAMDPSHVALIDLLWSSSGFKEFTSSSENSFTVRMEDFNKIIRRATQNDSIRLAKSGSNSLLVNIGTNREFELHLIDYSVTDSPLPKLNYDARFTIDAKAFERALCDVSTTSNHVTINVENENAVTFSGKGDVGKSSVTIEKTSKEGTTPVKDIVCLKPAKSTYSVEYLQKIIKPQQELADTILFEYSTKMPLKMRSVFAGTYATLDFYLAPRVAE